MFEAVFYVGGVCAAWVGAGLIVIGGGWLFRYRGDTEGGLRWRRRLAGVMIVAGLGFVAWGLVAWLSLEMPVPD